MKDLKDRIYDCTPTEFDPSDKERITDIRISQGPRIKISYQRGTVDAEGVFQASRPYDVGFVGERAAEIITALESSLITVLSSLQTEKERPGKTILEKRQEYLQGQTQKIIDGTDDSDIAIVPGEPRTEHPIVWEQQEEPAK